MKYLQLYSFDNSNVVVFLKCLDDVGQGARGLQLRDVLQYR